MDISDITVYGWIVAVLCGIMVGASKAGIPGMGIVVVPLIAGIMPPKASTGALLPLLILADILAVAYWRKEVQWKHLFRIFPWAMAGIIIGYFLMDRVDNAQVKPILGVVILFLLALGFWWRQRKMAEHIPTHWSFAAFMGIFAGITTMMFNAAGPIVVIYLLAMRMHKKEFQGTRVWYFLILNCVKVPFSTSLGLITSESLKFDMIIAPTIFLGAFIGILVAKRLPEKAFYALVQILAAASAIKLLVV